MVKVTRYGQDEWSNYHQTLRFFVEDQVELSALGDEATPADDYFRSTADAIKLVLSEAIEHRRDVRPIGAAWSFSRLLATQGELLFVNESARAFRLGLGQLDDSAIATDRNLLLASGFLKIADLNLWLEKEDLSLRTSGASNGQSIAGALATGTHGSVIGEGAFQNHVRGLHLVVATDKSVWLEPVSGGPYLDDRYARQFCDEIVCSDELFAAVLVHLGGFGVVNAVLLDVADKNLFGFVQIKKTMTPASLALLQEGRFHDFSKWLDQQYDEQPYYVQVILNPFDPTGSIALHRLLLLRKADRGEPIVEARRLIGDPLQLISTILELYPDLRPKALPLLMRAAYQEREYVEGKSRLYTWGETTPAHNNVGRLFSASISIDRSDLVRTVEIMSRAFNETGGGELVFTLRFVSGSRGTLAFDRFDQAVIIDMDGIDSPASRLAAAAVIASLDSSGIDHGLHWGKLGGVSAATVRRNFGDPAHPNTAAGKWVAARQELLSDDMQRYFANGALRDWGLA